MMDAPILQYRFSHINNNQITDYASGIDGTVNGSCTIVTDTTMGNCIQFDGSTGFISLGDLNFDFSNGLTLTAWVYYDAFNDYSRILDFGCGSPSNNIVFYNNQTTDEVRFANYVGTSETRLDGSCNATKGEWQHIAVTVTPAGLATLYLDGTAAGTNTNSAFLPANVARTSNYIGKSNWAGNGFFQGKMAWLSMFNSALSSADIVQEMNNALLERGAYRASFPVGFKLQSNNQGAESPVIYLENSGAGETLSLSIENSSNSTLALSAAAGTTPTESNYHFQLRFRPGVLSSTVLKKGQLTLSAATGTSVSTWQISQGQSSDGSIYVSLLATGSTLPQINNYQSIQLDFEGVVADPTGGSRTTNVEFFYQNVGFSATGASLQGSRLQHLDIISHIGQKNIPLKADIVGSPTILNNGSSANEVLIRILNTSDSDISLVSGNPATTFTVYLPGQATNTLADWALAEMDNLAQVQLQWGVMAITNNSSSQTSIPLQKPLVQSLSKGTAIIITPPGSGGTTISATLSSDAVEGARTININKPESVVANSTISLDVNNGTGWLNPASSEEPNSMTFTIKNASQTSLAAGECLVIVLSNIVTGVMSGVSAITIGYSNIPGYWDGDLSVELLKSPLVCNQDSVGIGTNAPTDNLEVNGTMSATGNVSFDSDLTVSGNTSISSNLTVTGTVAGVGLPPVNSIIMLSGTTQGNFNSDGVGESGTPYEGWALCDGQNGRPDLRSKFIVGAGNDHGDYNEGSTGGATTHNHEISISEQIIHTTKEGGHHHTLPSTWKNRSLSCGRHHSIDTSSSHTSWDTSSVSDHDHSITISAQTITTTEPKNASIPPYYALYFIIRVQS